jgi:formylglycine-generating enzyme required for sulfatase activity
MMPIFFRSFPKRLLASLGLVFGPPYCPGPLRRLESYLLIGVCFLAPRSAWGNPPHTVQSASNLEMLWVEPGSFMMGSPTSETGRDPDETEHNVTLTKGFYLGKYEVTQAQYQAVMTGNSNGLSATPSQYPGNPNRPVEKVSWDDVQVFLTRLNDAEQTAGRLPTGWQYVLPTESEWEYACRAGTTTAYSWGASFATTNANYNASGINQTRDVGQYAANPWGFFDMHGNVWECTADWYGTYLAGPVTDPSGPTSGSYRVLRGGSWYSGGAYLRSAWRLTNSPINRPNYLGFRVGFKQVPHTVPSASNLEMLWVEPGSFMMGSPTSETNRDPGETEHNVTLTKGFYLGKYEVTQAQYEAVMTGNSNGLSVTPSQYSGNPNRPVEKVSWYDAQVFLTRLNDAEIAAGRLPAGWSYVLPTEAEWEYACRAGTTTAYSWGAAIASSNANYSSSGISQTTDVGQYAANPWGFFDMHGNVWEWVADWNGAYPTGPVTDPSGATSGSYRILRGGGWDFDGKFLRSAERNNIHPSGRYNTLGFRVGFKQTNEPPVFSNPPSVSVIENQTLVLTVTASDPDGDSLTYSLAGGTDQGAFVLNSFNSSTGLLTFKNAPDFEANASAAGNNAYFVTVQVTDGIFVVTQALTINVINVNESPVFTTPTTATVPENQTFALNLNAPDPDGDGLTYFISGGADQAKFAINPVQGVLIFKSAPDFENPGSAAGSNTYAVTVQVSDGALSVTQALTITVTDQIEPPVFTFAASPDAPENQTFVLDLNATDPDGGALTFSIAGGADESSFGLNPSTGVLIFLIIPDFENPVDADTDNSYELTVQVSDGSLVTTQALQVRVTDLFRPIVETGLVESLTGSAATLKGEIVDDGGLTVTGRGILFSLDPDPELGKPGVTNLAAGQGAGAFSAQATGLESGRKYYFRAYARNGEGASYGSDGEFVMLFDGKNPGWIDATPGEVKDWWTSPWLGSFFLSPNGWAMHGKLGWVYPVESPMAGLWLWKEGMGWLWTDDGIYPFLYGAKGTGWHYFFGQHEATRLFYDYGKGEWRTLE